MSSEVRIMSILAAAVIRSVVGRNVYNMKAEFDLDPWRDSSRLFHDVPEVDKWRLPLLKQMLDNRYEMKVCGEETDTIDGLSLIC